MRNLNSPQGNGPEQRDLSRGEAPNFVTPPSRTEFPNRLCLEQAIRNDPGNRDLRLVYAGVLRQEGEEERALIIECQADGSSRADDPVFSAAVRRLWSKAPAVVKDIFGEEAPVFKDGFMSSEQGEPYDECFTLRPSQFVEAASWISSLTRNSGIFAFERGTYESYERMFSSPYLVQLRMVSLCDSVIDSALVRKLADSPYVHNIFDLSFTGASIGNDGLRAISNSQNLAGLYSLGVAMNGIDSEGLAAVYEPNRLGGLAFLDLTGNWCTGRDFVSLLQSTHSPSLEVLLAGNNPITPREVADIVSCPKIASVRHLCLANGLNQFSTTFECAAVHDSGAEAIARSPYLRNLRTLNLANTGIGEAGVHALVTSPTLKELETLDVSGTPLSPAMCAALRRRFGSGAAFTSDSR